MATPLSPAIHLGADRVVTISVRHSPDRDSNVHVNYVGHDQGDISIADIAGVMLNAAFMDALDSDAERLIRINHTLTLIEERRRYTRPLIEIGRRDAVAQKD